MTPAIKTRFAPSPTGEPHLGNIRTALFAWLFAKSRNGDFILRIEDTDKSRTVKGAVEAILASLDWLGLDWDKNQKSKIKNQKYKSKIIEYHNLIFQSQRLEIYQKYAAELVKKGHAYVCDCSEERLKKLRERQITAKQPPMYDGFCRNKTQNSKLKTQNYVIRLKVPHNGQTEFDDIIRGNVSFENKLIDDQVLLKSDGYPTYHLANVADDHLMEITHVIRAEEWLSSTPKHLLLYKFFDWPAPQFAHLPMILGPDKSKLSKRHGATSILEYKRRGYLPEAMVNYLSLLGWRPNTDQEIFTRQELISQFTLERVQKSAAIFDQEKLDWLNGLYIRSMAADDLVQRIWKFLADNGQIFKLLNCDQKKDKLNDSYDCCRQNFKQGFFKRAVLMVKDRLKKFDDFAEMAGFIFDKKLQYNKELLIFVKSDLETTVKSLKLALAALIKIENENFTQEKLKQIFNQLMRQHQLTGGDILHPLRISLSGLKDSPGPFEIAEVLGQEETVRRIELALEKMEE